MRSTIITAALLVITSLGMGADVSNVDPAHQYAWTENAGWSNWTAGIDGAYMGLTFLGGLVWAENVGWINLGDGSPADGIYYANVDGSDFGVNLDFETGELFGLAWGENIGWINFDTFEMGAERARYDGCGHRFYGYAWAENIGWINLHDSTHYVAVGPCPFGDYDCNAALDLFDYALFPRELTGPAASAECPTFDADADGDVDLSDFGAFQAAFTGE